MWIHSKIHQIAKKFCSRSKHVANILKKTYLTLVDMVIWMDRLLAPQFSSQHLDCPVTDHLIHIHVALGSRSSLPDHQWKVFFIQTPIYQLSKKKVTHQHRSLIFSILEPVATLNQCRKVWNKEGKTCCNHQGFPVNFCLQRQLKQCTRFSDLLATFR